MCIRDSNAPVALPVGHDEGAIRGEATAFGVADRDDDPRDCLLYTSDAADERSSVDLGGRRIIKKKNKQITKHTRHVMTILHATSKSLHACEKKAHNRRSK